MQGTWFKVLGLGIMLLAFGCRTPKPNLKPDPRPEVCITPPSENRFNTPVYPKEAFNNRDAIRKLDDEQTIQPTVGKSLSQGAR